MIRGLRSLPAIAAALTVALAVAALASLAPGSPLVASCAGAGSNHAAVVVEHGDGSVVTRCVGFAPASVTGESLLDASGVAWSGQTFGGFGEAVCALDGEPAHYADCPGKDSYWAVFVARAGGGWQVASVGISTLTLGDGDAEGFRYVPAVGTLAPPPDTSGVCAGAAASATSSPGSTAGARSPATTNPPPSLAAPSTSVSPASAATTSSVGGAQSPAASGALAAAPFASPSGAGAPATSVPPVPGKGVDLGLLAAALAGGGLAGLALLRVLAVRRSP